MLEVILVVESLRKAMKNIYRKLVSLINKRIESADVDKFIAEVVDTPQLLENGHFQTLLFPKSKLTICSQKGTVNGIIIDVRGAIQDDLIVLSEEQLPEDVGWLDTRETIETKLKARKLKSHQSGQHIYDTYNVGDVKMTFAFYDNSSPIRTVLIECNNESVAQNEWL